ncbi:MAG: acyl-CoA dehydrogenase [Flavipsychrobacter sp.]|nr:acyl-CoA dehydrogenase [Flavipsychrobacter sp.]
MANTENAAIVMKQKQLDAIREQAAKAEKDAKPTRAQLAQLYEQNFFNLLAPAAYGGLQLAIPEALQVLENLSWADGSMGWLTAKGVIAGWAGGFINPEVGKELLSGDKVHVTGTNEVSGIAEKTKTGYTVTGHWSHVAGIAEASAFIAHCTIMENGATIKDEAHKEQVLSFILLKDELTLSVCSSMGLASAGCHDVDVKNLKVAANRAFILTAEHAAANARLYQYPYLQLSEAVLAATVSGMATRLTELCQGMINEMKDNNGAPLINDNMVQDTIEKYTQKMNDARVKLYYAAELTWQACVNQQTIKDTILYKVSAAAQDLTRKARECTDAILPFCGIAAMDKGSEINRVWRDLHTASQEKLLVFGGL